jgi:4-hydroxybenzoate polyprenyltransferase
VSTGEQARTTASRVIVAQVWSLFLSLRPRQWTKNTIVFAAIIFDGSLFNLPEFARVAGAFLCFCLASGAVYLINDLLDRESDRLHPKKRFRPIAAGRVSERLALGTAFLTLAVSLGLAFLLRPSFGGIVALYAILMVSYSLWLKHLVLIDVFAIAAGFVFRAAGGAVVLAVPISPWLYVCTVLLALFLGFGKRRQEIRLLDDVAGSHRRNLDEYSVEMLDQFLIVTAAATIMAYSLYTFVAPNVPDNHAMMLTIPLVMYGMFRYLFLVHYKGQGDAPDQVLLSDRPLLATIILWGLTSILILYLT